MNNSTAIQSRGELIAALESAAQLEHNVICMYLYAAHSLKSHPSEPGVDAVVLERVREWHSRILTVARGEMEHLGLVCNLLSAVGGVPDFRRLNFPQAAPFCPPGVRFELMPFSRAAIERFMQLEKSHGQIGTEDHETIGDLYQRIRDGIEHLSQTEGLFVGSERAQVSNRSIGLPDRWYEIRLRAVTSLAEALDVIDQILESGDHAGENAHPTHYELFAEVADELSQMTDADPVRPVVANPVMPGNDVDGCVVIDHPITFQAASLFNAVYETMILMMTRYYVPTDESDVERKTLENLTLFPIMTVVLRPLAEILTKMPINKRDSGTAGPTFQLSSDVKFPREKTAAWRMIDSRLRDHSEECAVLRGRLERTDEPWAPPVIERVAFLADTLSAIAVKFDFYMQSEHGRFWTEYKRMRGH